MQKKVKDQKVQQVRRPGYSVDREFDYDPDCPACLRGLQHTAEGHYERLRRVREASL